MFYAVLGYARAIVCDGDVGCSVGPGGTHLNVGIVAPSERLRCIAHEIDERERQQVGVGIEAHLGRRVQLEYAVSCLVAQQTAQFGKQLLDGNMAAHRIKNSTTTTTKATNAAYDNTSNTISI